MHEKKVPLIQLGGRIHANSPIQSQVSASKSSGSKSKSSSIHKDSKERI